MVFRDVFGDGLNPNFPDYHGGQLGDGAKQPFHP
jgi:hypothetical protein